MLSDSVPDFQNSETTISETGGWVEMPASWIGPRVLDDLVRAGLGDHEQIAASVLHGDGPFTFLISLLTDKERLI